jgi:sortase (surface protein transpeptidase)
MPAPAFVAGVAGDWPVRLRIPAVGIDANIESLAPLANGVMDVPHSVGDAGWLRTGVAPGASGNAVMTGHLDDGAGQPAAFWTLNRLRRGDTILVTTATGAELRFVVLRVGRYDRHEVPLVALFGPSREANLNLVTCAGPYLRSERSYRDRLVIYTRLVSTTNLSP